MRPAGKVRQALLQACAALAVAGQGVTLREMAHAAQVGLATARNTVSDMRRAGQIRKVGERPVDYRNRPVAEYAPAAQSVGQNKGCMSLANVLRVWAG